MKTKVDIYQGNRVGGSVVVVTVLKDGRPDGRIMIDYGLPLPGETAAPFEHDWEKEPVDAVFFTHAHADHIGRFAEIPDGVPLYMGSTTREILKTTKSFLCKNDADYKADNELYILCDDNRVRTFNENEPVKTGDNIVVTPYSVDHSVYDAYMFLIETPDKNILHTGDYRGHGYRGSKMLKVIEHYVRADGKRDTDILITEGTMVGRTYGRIFTEYDMQQEAARLFAEHKYVFVICASTNADSLASFYQAGLKNGRRMYAGSRHLREQLKIISETAGKKSALYKFNNIYCIDLTAELKSKWWDEEKTQKEMMLEHGFVAVIKPEPYCEAMIDAFKEQKPLLIYSNWEGYLDAADPAYNKGWDEFLKRQEAKGLEVLHLHTGGHAYPEFIAEVIEAVNPREAIIPVHTDNAEGFLDLPISEELKEKIRVIAS